MATLGNLENKPVLVSEMRKYVGDISAHARGGNTLKATKTGAIVNVDDAYAGALLKLTAYGNSVQNGTPTPDAPVEIKSVAGVKAVTAGKNLLDVSNYVGRTNIGLTYSYADGAIRVSGTSTGTSYSIPTPNKIASWMQFLPAGTYTLSFETVNNTFAMGIWSIDATGICYRSSAKCD